MPRVRKLLDRVNFKTLGVPSAAAVVAQDQSPAIIAQFALPAPLVHCFCSRRFGRLSLVVDGLGDFLPHISKENLKFVCVLPNVVLLVVVKQCIIECENHIPVKFFSKILFVVSRVI